MLSEVRTLLVASLSTKSEPTVRAAETQTSRVEVDAGDAERRLARLVEGQLELIARQQVDAVERASAAVVRIWSMTLLYCVTKLARSTGQPDREPAQLGSRQRTRRRCQTPYH